MILRAWISFSFLVSLLLLRGLDPLLMTLYGGRALEMKARKDELNYLGRTRDKRARDEPFIGRAAP